MSVHRRQEMNVPRPSITERETRDAIDLLIKTRFASRSFSDRAVPRELIEEILDVARFAPSGGNIQPWRVYLVSGKKKEEISASLLDAHDCAREQHTSEYKYYAAVLPEPFLSRKEEFGRLFYGALGIAQTDVSGRAKQTSKNYQFFGAPVGMIITIDRRLEVGSWLDLGMFVQNVMLAAAARGVHTCPQETFAKYHAILRRHLPIPDEEMVACGMSLGFAHHNGIPTERLMPKIDVNAFADFSGFAD
jgi:nitroreductase